MNVQPKLFVERMNKDISWLIHEPNRVKTHSVNFLNSQARSPLPLLSELISQLVSQEKVGTNKNSPPVSFRFNPLTTQAQNPVIVRSDLSIV